MSVLSDFSTANLPGKLITRIDHVALVVRNIDEALGFYRDVLGMQPSGIKTLPAEGVRIAFLPSGGPGGSEIELVEPLDPTTGVAQFLEKRGEGLHHICLETPDIDAALAYLQARLQYRAFPGRYGAALRRAFPKIVPRLLLGQAVPPVRSRCRPARQTAEKRCAPLQRAVS